jgi:hypothetical protein
LITPYAYTTMKIQVLSLLVSAFLFSVSPAVMAMETAPTAEKEFPIFGKKKVKKAKSSKSKSSKKMYLNRGKRVR